MKLISVSTAALALAACVSAACGISSDEPPDEGGDARAPSEAPPADPAAPAAPPPASPRPPDDAPAAPARDIDQDGYPSSTDCNDNDPTVWRLLAYASRDADGDQYSVAASGSLCAGLTLPPGYSAAAPQPGAVDCDDTNPVAFSTEVGYLDLDGDSVGAGLVMTFCAAGGLPAGAVAAGGDCAALDPARWIDRPYSFRDADGDGAAVSVPGGIVCTGAALPPGYLTSAPSGAPLDCNDADAAVSIPLTVFADLDGDGIGAGPSQLACTDGDPADGASLEGTDCNDADALHWEALAYAGRDADGDGATVPASGVLCTDGELPPTYEAAQSGNDCDDADPARTRFAVLYPDQDEDGVGAPPRQVQCIGAALPAGVALGGYDEDDLSPGVIERGEDDALDLILFGQ